MRIERSKAILLVLLAGLAIAGTAQAAGLQCTTADKSTWLPAAAVKKLLQDHGFTNVGAIKAMTAIAMSCRRPTRPAPRRRSISIPPTAR